MGKNIGSKLSVLFGGLAGINGVSSFSLLTRYFDGKSEVLQKLLSLKPEITKDIYDIAEETSRTIVDSGNLYVGVLTGTIAGLLAGASVYFANNKDSDEEE